MAAETVAQRARAQLLHRPRRSPASIVEHMLAVQAQDIRQAPLALRARGTGFAAADVEAARARGDIVRAWGPRGTIHFMAGGDAGWLTALLLPAYLGQARRRLAQEGVAGSLERLLDVTRRAMAGQGPLTKAELGERLAALGTHATGQGIVYLAFLAAIHGYAVFGPDRGTRPTYVHCEPSIPVDRNAALSELAVRYLRAHQPAGPEDLAAWSGLGLTECRAAFAVAADRLQEVSTEDGPLWRLRRATSGPSPAGVVLLPGNDEYLLGWRSRAAVLDPAHARAVIPGGGVIRPAVSADGRIVGTWRANPFAADLWAAADPDLLTAEAADLRTFLP